MSQCFSRARSWVPAGSCSYFQRGADLPGLGQKAVFPRLQMCQHSHILCLRLFLQSCRAEHCMPSAWCYLHALGHGLGAVGCFDFLFFFFFPLGVATHNDVKMCARKCRSHGCCGEGGRRWCRGSAACPRAFRRLAHVVLPWLIPAGHQPAAGPGQGEWGQPSGCCQPPPLAGRGRPPSPLLSPSPQAP